jgi:hypothetical protein
MGPSTRYVSAGVPQETGISFVSGTPIDVTFPFTPAARDLTGDTPFSLTLVAGRPTLRYPETAATTSLTVTIGGQTWAAGETGQLADGLQVTVRGRTGTIGDRQDQALRVLSWPEEPDRWVELSAPLPTATEAMVKYAQALTDQPVTQPGPFVFDLVPAGFAVDNIDPSAVTFSPPGVAASADYLGKLAVLFQDGQATAEDGAAVTVAGRTARIRTQDGMTVLRVDEGVNSVVVQVPTAVGIAQPDLLRFAAGIHPTAGAVSGRG